MKKSPLLTAMQYLSWLTQLGLSFATPLIMCILGAWWLNNRFHIGTWIIILGVVLGIGGGISSFAEFAKYFMKKASQSENNNKSE